MSSEPACFEIETGLLVLIPEHVDTGLSELGQVAVQLPRHAKKRRSGSRRFR